MTKERGRINVYTCQTCGGHMVTEDVDRGTTPFMTKCWVTPGCRGPMVSAFYRVDQGQSADWEWYSPPNTKRLSPETRDHVLRGGWILRRKTAPVEAK